MKIEVCCGVCAKRFAAPERLAGKRVKCPVCGGAIDVPALEPLDALADDPLAGFSEQDLTAGPALAGLTPPPTRPPSSQPAPASSPAASGRAASRTASAGDQQRSIFDVFFQHKLFGAVAAVTGLGLVSCVSSGHLISAAMYLIFGGGACLVGLWTVLNPSKKPRVEETHGELISWWAGSALLLLIIAVAMSRAGKTADPLQAAVFLGGAMILIFLVVGMACLFALLLDLARGRGAFRSVAIGYLMLFGAVPMVALATMPAGLGGGGVGAPAVAKKTAKDLPSIPLPLFPERGPARTLQPGVELSEVRLTAPSGQPGQRGKLYVYLPSGAHAPRSLPCVLIAPAGSTLLHGMELSEGNQEEHTPYVKAGFAVVGYELDGPLDEPGATERSAFEQYAASLAGLVNARNALEYVLQRMPEVDPERVYAAGHSSAGTMALVLAEHEPRIKGCVVYAPATDLVERNRPMATQLGFLLPGSQEFLAEWSPRTHEARLQCPVFLFHARDDSVVPFGECEAFSQRLKALGKQVTFKAVDSGDHYDSMIEEGIPAGIEWLKTRSGPSTGSPAKQ